MSRNLSFFQHIIYVFSFFILWDSVTKDPCDAWILVDFCCVACSRILEKTGSTLFQGRAVYGTLTETHIQIHYLKNINRLIYCLNMLEIHPLHCNFDDCNIPTSQYTLDQEQLTKMGPSKCSSATKSGFYLALLVGSFVD